jgi:hypothetical protein
MEKSLESFMSGLIDYAGLFPPANLPLNEAILNYSKYIRSNYKWMLSKFILPVKLLGRLEFYMNEFTENFPLRLAILAEYSKDEESFIESFHLLLKQINTFKSKYNQKVTFEVIELKIPNDVLDQGLKVIKAFIASIRKKIEEQEISLSVFYEVPFTDFWNKHFLDTIIAISEDNTKINLSKSYLSGGLKIRTGGVEKELFPEPFQLAEIIQSCVNTEVSFKATAGLHHPFRHFNREVDTKMHGFINMFGAGILAKKFNLARQIILEILINEDPNNFNFSGEKFRWKEFEIEFDEIEFERNNFAIGYGSCSLIEPIDDLREVNLLNGELQA